MTDDAWEDQRNRAILTAFQTGRPVFADTDGELRFADGNQEAVPDGVVFALKPTPRTQQLAKRAERASCFAFGMSLVAAIANGIAAIWNPWQLAVAVVFGGCTFLWRKVNRSQRLAISKQASSENQGESP